MQRKLDEILEKLDKEEEPGGGGCEFDVEEIEYVVCSEDCQGAEMDRFTLEVRRGSMTAEKREILDDQVMLAAKGCSSGDVVASIPDWWPVRLGAERPQLVVVFRRANTSDYHQIAIPWPTITEPPETSPLPAYRKGNFHTLLTLKDNSKFLVNCANQSEGQKMLDAAKSVIDPSLIDNPPREHCVPRKGPAIGEHDMIPVRMDYFPTGQRTGKPAWRKRIMSS